MSVNLIVIMVFFLIMILVAVLYRGSTLDRMELQEGEKVLFEESGIRVEQSGSPRSVIFGNCIVRVTERRIIIAQKMLFRNKYVIRHVIIFTDGASKTDLAGTFKKGYILMGIQRSAIRVEVKNGSGEVMIKIPETPITMNQYIVYKTGRTADYISIMG